PPDRRGRPAGPRPLRGCAPLCIVRIRYSHHCPLHSIDTLLSCLCFSLVARPQAPTLMPAPDCLYTGIFPRNSSMSDYVKWFRHSTPYINTHRDRTFVVLLPGEAIAH